MVINLPFLKMRFCVCMWKILAYHRHSIDAWSEFWRGTCWVLAKELAALIPGKYVTEEVLICFLELTSGISLLNEASYSVPCCFRDQERWSWSNMCHFHPYSLGQNSAKWPQPSSGGLGNADTSQWHLHSMEGWKHISLVISKLWLTQVVNVEGPGMWRGVME